MRGREIIISKAEGDKIELEYLNGKSLVNIAPIFGYSHPVIAKELRKRGVHIRTSTESIRKYHVDESFFDVIK